MTSREILVISAKFLVALATRKAQFQTLHVGRDGQFVQNDFLSSQVASGLTIDLFREGKGSITFRIELKITQIYPYLTDNEKSPVKNMTNFSVSEVFNYSTINLI